MRMRTDRDKLILEYYKSIDPPPPESYEEFLAICKTPFLSLKKTIQAGTLFEVRLMNFGKFAINGGVIAWTLHYNHQQHEKGNMSEEDYRDFIDAFNAMYKRHPEKFKKHMEKVKQWIY